jgi:MFS family permease
MGLMMAILQAGLIGRIVDLLGELGVLAVGTCLTIIGFLVAAFATGETTILIGFFSVITGATLCTPVLNSLVSKRTAFIHRGRIMGTTSSMSAWGRMCGPIMAGVLLSIFGYQIAWLGGLLFCLWSASWVASEIHHAKKQTVELM